MAVKHKAQRAAAGAVLDQLLKYVDKDPQANLLKLMDKVQGIVGNLFPANPWRESAKARKTRRTCGISLR